MPPGPGPAPRRRGFRRRLRRLVFRIRDWLFARTRLVLAGFAAGIALLVWPGLGLRLPLYEVGQIAPRTVRAVNDFGMSEWTRG